MWKLLVVLAFLVVVNTVPVRTVLVCTTSICIMASTLHKPVEQGVRGWRLAILSVAVCLTTCANVCFWL
jgi:hypothetical protein